MTASKPTRLSLLDINLSFNTKYLFGDLSLWSGLFPSRLGTFALLVCLHFINKYPIMSSTDVKEGSKRSPKPVGALPGFI